MMISDLPRDLVEEILSRVPLLSMRSVLLTCKKWSNLCKRKSFIKLHNCKAKSSTKKGESMMLATFDHNLYLTSVNVSNVFNPSIKIKAKLTSINEKLHVLRVFHCDGLLLCSLYARENNVIKLVVWNPCLGQTRWIEQPDFVGSWIFCYAIGYEDKKNSSCRKYKVLKFIDCFYNIEVLRKHVLCYEIYDIDSGLWKSIDFTPHWLIAQCYYDNNNVSLKGNTYWFAKSEERHNYVISHIICFDFTRESFGPLLPLPFRVYERQYRYVTLSCVGEEKLAALLQHKKSYPYELEIWITTKIETDVVSWSKFLTMTTGPEIMVPFLNKGFEDKEVAMRLDEYHHETVDIIGEARYSRELYLLRETERRNDIFGLHACSYVPSFAQIKKRTRGKKRRRRQIEQK